MRKFLLLIAGLTFGLSMVILLYGCMKLARLEQATAEKIEMDIPGVKVERADQALRQKALAIIAVSACFALVSGGGMLVLVVMGLMAPPRKREPLEEALPEKEFSEVLPVARVPPPPLLPPPPPSRSHRSERPRGDAAGS